jgi:hypothetical protein
MEDGNEITENETMTIVEGDANGMLDDALNMPDVTKGAEHFEVDLSDLPDDEPTPIENEPTEEPVTVESKPSTNPFPDLVDREGNPFDPEVHQVYKSGKKKGQPILTATGKLQRQSGKSTFKKKESKSKSQIFNVDEENAKIQAQNATQKKEELAHQYQLEQIRLQAEMITGIFTNTTGMIIGPEWFPKVLDEKTGITDAHMLTEATERYMRKKGFKELPPFVELLSVYGAYSQRRLSEENTQTWCKSFFEKAKHNLSMGFMKLKGWWMNRRGAKCTS